MNCINVDLTLDVFQLQLYLFNGVLVYVPTVYFIMVGSIVRLFAHYSHIYLFTILHSLFPYYRVSTDSLSTETDWLSDYVCLGYTIGDTVGRIVFETIEKLRVTTYSSNANSCFIHCYLWHINSHTGLPPYL